MSARLLPILTVALSLAALPALAAGDLYVPVQLSSVQQNALKDGCKKRYAKNKKKYNECLSGNAASSDNALIDGCYARYQHQRDKLRQCLGR
jgi:hypothetical protein